MAPDFPWLAIVVIVAAVGWFVPKALTASRKALGWVAKVFAEAAADAIAERLGPRLAPSWLADFDDALEPIYQEISLIRFELTSNGGTSLKDRVAATASHVHEIQQAIEPLLHEYRDREAP